MAKLVRRSFANKPKLSPASIRRLKKLAASPDSEIDYSEIPPLSDDFFRRAASRRVRNPFVAGSSRQQMAVSLDPDVFAWLSGMGTRAQRKLNSVLRAAMQSSQRA